MANNQTESDKLSTHVAEEIRVWMTRRRMSGERLAKELGVSSAWISYRINGQVDLRLGELERIAAALGVEVAALLPAPARDVNARYGRVSGRPRSAAKLHARNSTPRPTTASAERQPVAAAAGAESAPRSRPFWRHA